ncbi:MAG: hypothetical protein AB8H80_08660 [Planctomycetota bacterium]
MFCKLSVSTLVCAFATTAASAQSFNIDVNASPSTTPSSTFGAYAGQPGVWNGLGIAAVAQSLSRLDGSADNSTASFSGALPSVGFNTGLPAVVADLYEDCAIGGPAGFSLEINDLDVGSYVAVVYSYSPNCGTFFRLRDEFNSVVAQEIVQCPPVWPATPAPGYIIGETMTLLPFDVFSQDGDITLDVLTDTCSALNGIQLVRYVGQTGCSQPTPNSTGGTPDIIATGSIVANGISAAANDMTLQVGVLPGSLPNGIGSILCWVSNGQSNSINYSCPGTGRLCLGPVNLARVPSPNSGSGSGGAGMTTAFGTYTLPVDLNYLQTQGINTSAGSTLYFQMIYRDADYLPQCGGGVVARWTNSVEIQLF